ncbi:unnamed protein product [Peniophora sp. CBMAI 1063]|nr:unnamed protein product [Peniophora sp. CBMAI 1063]
MLPSEDVDDFSLLLLDGPSSAIEQIRCLYLDHHGALLDPQDALVSKLSTLSSIFTPHLKAPQKPLFTSIHASKSETSARDVVHDRAITGRGHDDGLDAEFCRACIASGLPMLLIRMITNDNFLLQSEVWIVSVLNCLDGFVSLWLTQITYGPLTTSLILPDGFGLDLLGGLWRIWTDLWRNIDKLRKDDGPAQEGSGSRARACEALASLAIRVTDLWDEVAAQNKNRNHAEVLLVMDIAPVLLFAWTHAILGGIHDNQKLTRMPSVIHAQLQGAIARTERQKQTRDNKEPDPPPFGGIATTPWGGKIDPAIERIGAGRVVDAFRTAIESCAWMIDNRLQQHIRILEDLTAYSFACARPIREALWASTMTHALAVALRRQVRDGRVEPGDCSNHLSVCRATIDLLYTLCEGVERGVCHTTNGRDVMSIFELCYICGLNAMRLSGTGNHDLDVDTAYYIEKLVKATFRWQKFPLDRFDDGGAGVWTRNGDIQLMCIQMRGFAQEYWFLNMQRLLAPRDELRHLEWYHALVDGWSDLGLSVMVEIESEREKYDWRTARLCSWRECVFHKIPSTRVLAPCKGCKETRYCSAECQQKDWKGGHRKKCKFRLKD